MSAFACDTLPPRVQRGVRRRDLAADESLFRQGDRASAVFVVERGRIVLQRHLTHGAAVTVHVARAGEGFAEAALFADRYHCDAVAAAPTTVAAIPKSALLDAMRDDPALAAAVTAQLARQVQALRAQLELRNVRPARERVFRALLLAAGGDGLVALDRPLKEMAAEIGLTHEACYRALAALAARGRIRRSGRTIAIRRV